MPLHRIDPLKSVPFLKGVMNKPRQPPAPGPQPAPADAGGPVGLGREDDKRLVKQRSPRLACARIADAMQD